MSDVHQLSRGAYERLQAEHEDLTTRGRIEIAQAIERARELGDLSENGDYHAAKDQQGHMEARIRQLESILEERRDRRRGGRRASSARVASSRSCTRATTTTAERYLIGHIEERDDELDVISPGSPLGAALIGHARSTRSSTRRPTGTLGCEIVAVEVA